MGQTGRFISVEGTEGVGKSSNIAFIQDYLHRQGIPVHVTREPGGTPIAEQIRTILLNPSNSEPLSDDSEILLVFAARAQHIQQVIRPRLSLGEWVISDRFTDATFAYQGAGRGINWHRIQQLEQWVQGDLHPDLTLLLDMPVATAMQRVHARGDCDRFEQETLAFFERVRQGYHHRVKAEPQRFAVIDASPPLAQVQAQLIPPLQQLLKQSGYAYQ